MPIILYGTEVSPPCRSVLLTARALKIKIELKHVDLVKQENKTEEFLKMNPAHSIPVMDDGGFILHESRAIMAYLVGKYGKDDKLYPKDVKKRAKIDNMLQFELGNWFPSIEFLYYPMVFGGKPLDIFLEQNLNEKMAVLNTMLGRTPYFAGDCLSIADLSLVNSLASAEVFLGSTLTKYSNIVNYYDKIRKEIPFYDEVTKKGVEEYSAFMKSMLQK